MGGVALVTIDIKAESWNMNPMALEKGDGCIIEATRKNIDFSRVAAVNSVSL